MLKIYISSTYEDLKKERGAAAQAVRSLGHKDIGMEDYAASDSRPLDKCRTDVRSCDVYVGIFAWRYGSIPKKYDKSITHLEYEEAGKAGIPRLIFLLDSKAPWPVDKVDKGEEFEKIDQLRNELRENHTVSFFTNADQLGGKIAIGLKDIEPTIPQNKRKTEEDLKKHEKNKGEQKEKAKAKETPRYKWILVGASIIVILAIVILLTTVIDLRELEGMPEDVKKIAAKIGHQKVYKNEKARWEADHGDGIKMVYIPEGTFTMGSNDGNPNEKPQHEVYLDGYWMGKNEVTVKQYMKFVSETKSHYPVWLEEGNEYNINTGSEDDYKKFVSDENQPIVGISWKDAKAYCDWISKNKDLTFKLPTEAKWEKAARGTDGRKYSWGNLPKSDETLANFGRKKNKTSPVGSYSKGASPYGLMDMAGNVWEWCRDWYDPKYYDKAPGTPWRNPKGPKIGRGRVIRGGSWSLDAAFIRCAYRFGVGPSIRSFNLGFRLSQEIK